MMLNIGLPKGSLNTRGRGETARLLADARYDVKGYEPGNEDAARLRFANDPELRPYLIRPQSVGREMLDSGRIDVAILGSDWAEEWALSGRPLEKLADLGYGQTRLVFATKDGVDYAGLFSRDKIVGATELPLITSGFLMQNQLYRSNFGQAPSIYFRSLPVSVASGRATLEVSEGLTESMIAKDLADFVVDITQTGRTLAENGARVLDTILSSEACLYASPTAMQDFDKRRKAMELGAMLESVVNARNRVFYTMNVPSSQVPEYVDWLQQQAYCAKSPTVTMYGENAVVNILVKTAQIPSFLAGSQAFGVSDIVALDTSQVFAVSGGEGR